jgi:PQ loop repeat
VCSLILFLVFFPRATSLTNPSAENETNNDNNNDAKQPSYRTAVLVVIACIAHAAIVLIVSIAVAIREPAHLQAWANFLGIMSAALASIQYFPQIWTTFRLQKVGSLSIPMMCIQTPGSLVWAASLAQRLGVEGWSAWGVYVLTAILQGTLLVMGIYFEYLGPKKDVIDHPFVSDAQPAAEEEGQQEEDQQATENTPLLGEQR